MKRDLFDKALIKLFYRQSIDLALMVKNYLSIRKYIL